MQITGVTLVGTTVVDNPVIVTSGLQYYADVGNSSKIGRAHV